jgi:hypothetical protein
MYIRLFLERFWEGEQKNILFVCMPFHHLLDMKFNNIMRAAAKNVGLDDAVRVKEDWDSNVITTKIIDGIANSKLLLFDLSDDPKASCEHTRQVNANVLYELGVAHTIREPEDIRLIRDKSSTGKVPFDITGMTINPHDPNVSVDWLSALLTDALEKQEWHKSKRVKAATSSIDHIGLGIMRNPGTNPEGYDYFGIREDDPVTKMAIFRLMDLGIMRFHSAVRENLPEHTYRWTPFGYAVMKHNNLTQVKIEIECEWGSGHSNILR